MRTELRLGDTFDEATSKKYEGLLEKKWTSVVRLQKKVRSTVRDDGSRMEFTGPNAHVSSFR